MTSSFVKKSFEVVNNSVPSAQSYPERAASF